MLFMLEVYKILQENTVLPFPHAGLFTQWYNTRF